MGVGATLASGQGRLSAGWWWSGEQRQETPDGRVEVLWWGGPDVHLEERQPGAGMR